MAGASHTTLPSRRVPAAQVTARSSGTLTASVTARPPPRASACSSAAWAIPSGTASTTVGLISSTVPLPSSGTKLPKVVTRTSTLESFSCRAPSSSLGISSTATAGPPTSAWPNSSGSRSSVTVPTAFFSSPSPANRFTHSGVLASAWTSSSREANGNCASTP